MKKLRNEKPELSKKSPFYITKYRYYELKNFCLQYPDWKKALEQVNGWESSSHEVSGIIRGSLPESSTERQAIIRAYYSMHIDIIDRCVAKLEPAIGPCIPMEGVIEQVLHDSVVLMRITACRNTEHIGRLILADLNYWRKSDYE